MGPTSSREELATSLTQWGQEIAEKPGSKLTDDELAKLDTDFHEATTQHMGRCSQVIIACWLLLLGLASLVGLLWMWPIAERLSAPTGTDEPVRWFGPDFDATATTSLLILGVFAATAGSVVVEVIIFGLRAGNRTLEPGWEYWYLLRPIAAALLGLLFLLAVRTGLIASGPAQPNLTPNLMVLVTAAGLAGLFTDRVMQQMATLVGASRPDKPASTEPTVGFPSAQQRK